MLPVHNAQTRTPVVEKSPRVWSLVICHHDPAAAANTAMRQRRGGPQAAAVVLRALGLCMTAAHGTTAIPMPAPPLTALTIDLPRVDASAALNADDFGTFMAALEHLRVLAIRCRGLASLERGLRSGGGGWGGLRSIDLRQCRQFASLEGFEKFVCVEQLNLSHTAVASLEPLQHCQALRVLTLCNCQGVATLAGLEGLGRLEEVCVSFTSIASLAPLRTCSALKKVDATSCGALSSLDGLQQHRLLEEVNASNTAVASLRGLVGCQALRKLFLNRCEHLVTLEGFFEGGEDARQPATTSEPALPLELYISDAPLLSLLPLRSCHGGALRKLYLFRCRQLTSLAGLEGCPLLEDLYLSDLNITALCPFLAERALLRRVVLLACCQLTSVQDLGGLQWLEEVHVCATPVASLHPLRTCPALKKVVLGERSAAVEDLADWSEVDIVVQ